MKLPINNAPVIRKYGTGIAIRALLSISLGVPAEETNVTGLGGKLFLKSASSHLSIKPIKSSILVMLIRHENWG